MKALSIRQPWASALFEGKTIEVRQRFPGGRQPLIGERIFIHAGQQWFHSEDSAIRHSVLEFDGSPWNSCGWWRDPERTPRGVLLGTAVFVGVVRYHEQGCGAHYSAAFAADVAKHWNDPDWFGGPCVGLKFDSAHKLPRPIPFRGEMGFFGAPFTVAEELAAAK